MQSLELFRHPSVLFALVVPLALFIWTLRRGGRGVVLPLDGAHGRASRVSRILLKCAESLPSLLLAVAILILAGPQSWEAPRSKRVMTNIQFCVDVSGSMTSPFGDGDRYDAAMKAINSFVDHRSGDAFGLTFFGDSILHWVPLTNDISAFKCAPPFMHPGTLPYWFNGTEIGKALLACRKELVTRESGDRMIVLVTDGYSADLYDGRDEEIARELKKDGIVVYTIQVAEGDIPPEVVRIASETGGEAFKPENTDALEHAFARIDNMQKARIEKTQAEATDDYRPWCLVGLGALALAALALFGLRYTPW